MKRWLAERGCYVSTYQWTGIDGRRRTHRRLYLFGWLVARWQRRDA